MEQGAAIHYSIERLCEERRCDELIAAANSLIDAEYTTANVRARRSYVYEYLDVAESFAFALHCPGSDETQHLPGFDLSQIPEPLAAVSREVCERLQLKRGRVLFNAGRYPANAEEIMPHYDGELFDFSVIPDVGQEVRSGIRPRNVAILTLRNDSLSCETQLHEDQGKVTQPTNRAGDLLCLDNTVYQHGVPATGPAPESDATSEEPRWLRYTLGWRALEDDCFYWEDGQPLRPVDFNEAIRLHERFLEDEWPSQTAADLARGSFPFPTAFA